MTEAEIMIQLLGDLLQKVEEQDEQLRAMQSHLLSVERGLLSLSEWSQAQELRQSQQHEVQERHLTALLGQLSQATKEHLGQLSEAEKADLFAGAARRVYGLDPISAGASPAAG